MNPKSTPQQFFAFIAPIALEICAQIPKEKGTLYPETVMVQAADETEYNTAGCWHGIEGWEGQNNFSGISPGGKLGNYATIDEYVKAYVATITQNAYGFPAVLQATNPTLQMTRLGKSEWAGSHYDVANDGRPGKDLIAIYGQYGELITQAIQDAKKGTSKPQETATASPVADANVKKVQEELNEVDQAGLAVDGIDGPKTEQAVKEFQHEHGLTEDGVAGPNTTAALEEAVSKATQATTTPTSKVTVLHMPVTLTFDVTQENGEVTKISLTGAGPAVKA